MTVKELIAQLQMIENKDAEVINNTFKAFDKFLKDYQNEEGYSFCETVGLCTNVFDEISDNSSDEFSYSKLEEIKEKLFNSWEHFTGCYSYPVPFRLDKVQDKDILGCVVKRISSKPSEVAYNAQLDLYDKTNDYGLLRRDLYQHIKDNIFNVIVEI